MRHHTKDKGDLGVLKAQVDLAEQGFTVLLPLTEHAPFDLVAYKSGQFKRVQVKYRSMKNGRIEVSMRTAWSDKNGVHERPVDKGQVDVFCAYCPETNECYYFDPNDIGKSITLRIEPPKKKCAGVNLAENYRNVPD